MHPFVALMRKYCIDYTNSHDQSIYDQIMRPDYVVHSFGRDLQLTSHYSRGVEALFRLAPGLGLVVHAFVLNGDRLAMHFSEHASLPSGDGRALTCWRGIGLYRWDGERLVENWVEQDYHALKRQVAAGTADTLMRPHLDPWMATEVVPSDDAAVDAVRAWLAAGDLAAADEIDIDDSRDGFTYQPVLDVTDVVIDDIFSAGPTVPFHVTLHGSYRGGLGDEYHEHIGAVTAMGVSGIARLDDGHVTRVDAVTCRVQALAGLTGTLDVGF
jgi:hypothetical protein